MDHTPQKIRLIMHLRNAGIQDLNVLKAIESVPREIFMPEAVRHQAYDDIALPIGLGQTISQPIVVAKMTEAMQLTDRHKILEIGTGSGYQASILSKLCRRVYTIERHRPLFDKTETLFKDLNIRNITTLCGDGMKGWPKINGMDQAPFDRIIVTAAAQEKPPHDLLDQLSVGGIMVIPVGRSGEQMLKLYKKEGEDTFSINDLMPVRFVPLLPDIAENTENAYSKISSKARA